MSKDYLKWHELKTAVNDRPPIQKYHEREIWWCSIGENVGFEQDGKNDMFERPVLVLRKFNKELFIGVPLTTKHKRDNAYYVPVQVQGMLRSAITSQIRTISSRRLVRKIERLGQRQYDYVLREVLGAVKKTISADESAESPVPGGNLYSDHIKQEQKSQQLTSVQLEGRSFENSSNCKGISYVIPGINHDVSSIEITGRYPASGWAINHLVNETVCVTQGTGKLEMQNGDVISLVTGSVVYVPPKTLFAWDGNMTIIMICAPAFTSNQYEIIEE